MITQEELKETLKYNPDTGVFIRIKSNKEIKADSHGYVSVKLKGKSYQCHRLAWLYVHGHLPQKDMDHIDGDRLNNRIKNLRLVTPQENNKNRKLSIRNKSGVMGAGGTHRKPGDDAG